MRLTYWKTAPTGALKRLSVMLFGLVTLLASGCGGGGGVVVAVVPLDGSFVLEAEFVNSGQGTGGFVFNFGATNPRPPLIGANIIAPDVLKFSIDPTALPDFANLTVRLESPGVVTQVNLSDYVPVTVGVWLNYTIPLADFLLQGLDATNTIYLGFWDPRDSMNTLLFGKLYIDDVYFEDALGVPFGVYTETHTTNLDLAVSEIINSNDPQFNGNNTTTRDSVNGSPLPTDSLLNLRCADVGINDEDCVRIDPENPFREVAVANFNTELEARGLPQPPNYKFFLNNQLPQDSSGAKARFYLWAMALADRPSGENQWYVAQALHELYTLNGDPVIREQTIKAYRSVLENFFGSVTFFGTGVFDANGNEIQKSIQLNLQVGDDLYRSADKGLTPLFSLPGDSAGEIQQRTLNAISGWGFTYIPCTVTCPDDGAMFVNVF